MTRVLLPLIHLPILAPGLAQTDKRGTCTTVQRYIDRLREQRISVIEDINMLSQLTGQRCHDQVALVYATLLGQDSATHECVIYAVILGVLSHSTSSKKQLLESAAQDFVICPNYQRTSLIAASETGRLLIGFSISHLPLGLLCVICLVTSHSTPFVIQPLPWHRQFFSSRRYTCVAISPLPRRTLQLQSAL